MTSAFIKKYSKTIFIVFCLFAIDIAHSADQGMFDIYTLEVEGSICDYISGDFNGDKLMDIAMVYSPNNDPDNRYLGLFIQKMESGFGVRADKTILLPQSAAQVDAGDIDDDNIEEIVIMDSEGVLAFHLSAERPQSEFTRLIHENTIYSTPQFRGILVEPFLIKIANSGPVVVVSSPKGYVIFRHAGDGTYHSFCQLTAPMSSRNAGRGMKELAGSTHSEFNTCLASIHVADGNADGREDLYFLWDRRLCCYYQNESGNFSTNPDMDIDFYPALFDGYIQSQLIDMNGDKSPDVVVSCTSGGITKTETKVRFYLSNPDGRINPMYKKEITLSDSHCNLMVNDFNGDDHWEIAVPAVELGAIAATKMLLMKRADLHLLIYPITNGLPDNEPLMRPSFEFQFNFDNPNPIQEVTMNWMADYNGDKLLDMVISDGSGYLQFYWGREKDYLSKKTDLKISIDHPAEIHPINLNSGRFSDLVIEHINGGKLDRLTVLRNRGNKT